MTVSSTALSPTWTWTYTWDVPSGSDGVVSATVSGTDLFGNYYTILGTDSITYTIDNVSPTVTLTENELDDLVREGDQVRFDATFSEAMTASPEINIDLPTSATLTSSMTQSSTSSVWYYDWTVGSVATGTATITVSGTDIAGNTYAGTDSLTLEIDTTSPTITIEIDDDRVNNTDTPTITFTLSEASNTFKDGDALVSSGDIGPLTATSSTVYTASYTPASNTVTTVTVSVGSGAFTDIAGNTNISNSTTFEVDTVSPTLTLISDDHDDFIVRDADTVELTVVFSEAMTSTPTISITGLVTNTSMTVSSTALSPTWTWTYTWDVPSGSDGVVSATVSGTDLFGNYYTILGTDSITYTIDNVSPTLTIREGLNGDNSLKPGVSSITFTLTEPSNNFDVNDISIVSSSTSSGTLSNFTAITSSTYLVDYVPPTNYNGTVTMTVSDAVFTDIAGNTNTASQTAFIIDSSTPTATIIMSDYLVRGSETVSATFYFSEPIQPLVLGNLNKTLSSIQNLVTQSSTQYYSDITTYSKDGLNRDLTTQATIRVSNFYDTAGNKSLISFSDKYLIDSKLPKISSIEWFDTENYIAEIVFSESVYSNQRSTTIDKDTYKRWIDYLEVPDGNLLPLTPSSLNLTLVSATSSATATISSVTLIEAPQTPNTVRSAFGLVHKVKYRVALNVSGTLQGDEIINFMPSDGNSIFDLAGNPVSSTESKTLQFNQKPIVNSYVLEVNEGESASFIPVASDPDEDPIYFEFGDLYPMHGNVTIEGNTIKYTHYGMPQPLEDTFSIKAFDGITYSDNATVTVTIVPQNDPPMVSGFPEDFLKVIEGGGLTISLNAYDEENDPFESISIVTDPKYGSLQFIGDSNSDGVNDVLSYIHYGENTLQDQFSVIAKTTDGQVSSITTFTLNIIPENDVPVSPNQDIYIDQGETGSYIANASDEEGDPFEYILLEKPTKGGLVWITPQGSFSYAHNFDSTGFEVSNELYGFVYQDFLTYQVSGDGKTSEPGQINIYIIPFDHDQDGVPSKEEDLNRNGDFRDDDTDGDGIPNFLDVDDDNDGLLTSFENSFYADFNGDGDGDGISNYLDVDDDNDGVLTQYETIFNNFENPSKNPNKVRYKKSWDYKPKRWSMTTTSKGINLSGKEDVEYPDTDGDGLPDFFDIDDDNDGVLTKYEVPDINKDGNPADALDSDQESVPNYLDIDDDDDGVLTKYEFADQNGDGIPDDALDSDQEQIPNYLDVDDDNDSILTFFELPDQNGDGIPDDALDSDNEQIPDYLDVDDDNDSIPTINEIPDQDGDGVPDDALNSDNEDTPNYIDVDDDNDNVLTIEEDEDGDGNPLNNDRDNDGLIDAFESKFADKDSDGVSDEYDSENENPNNDQDGDGFGNMDETICGFDPLDPNEYPADMDADGIVNCIDDDIDGDGVPNEQDDFPENAFKSVDLSNTSLYPVEVSGVLTPDSGTDESVWLITNIDKHPGNSVVVYNKNGQVVYSAVSYKNNWRGNYKQSNEPLPAGTYYYIVRVSEADIRKGWLYITY
ncbi:Ig-like domain-containing protein [Flavobacteriaceae bacterium]|nr:Ig-like domain-containing protein [Flavobacteriaceae bacterium]